MARVCYVCSKGVRFGNNVSHANNKTRRRWLPNLRRVHIETEQGERKHVVFARAASRPAKCARSSEYRRQQRRFGFRPKIKLARALAPGDFFCESALTRPREPLDGRTIVVTRARAQAAGLGARLEARGAAVIYCPVIRFVPPHDPIPMQRAVGQLPSYDWLVLTSANGVSALVAELTSQGVDPAALRRIKIACVGPATAEALTDLGVRTQVMPDVFKSADIASALLAQVSADARVLLVRAERADQELPRRLRERLRQVDDVIAYRSVPDLDNLDHVKRLLEAGSVDAITFTSPSIVNYFVTAAGVIPRHVTLAAIGPVTASRMRELNLNPDVVAHEHTALGLVDAICEHYGRNESDDGYTASEESKSGRRTAAKNQNARCNLWNHRTGVRRAAAGRAACTIRFFGSRVRRFRNSGCGSEPRHLSHKGCGFDGARAAGQPTKNRGDYGHVAASRMRRDLRMCAHAVVKDSGS